MTQPIPAESLRSLELVQRAYLLSQLKRAKNGLNRSEAQKKEVTFAEKELGIVPARRKELLEQLVAEGCIISKQNKKSIVDKLTEAGAGYLTSLGEFPKTPVSRVKFSSNPEVLDSQRIYIFEMIFLSANESLKQKDSTKSLSTFAKNVLKLSATKIHYLHWLYRKDGYTRWCVSDMGTVEYQLTSKGREFLRDTRRSSNYKRIYSASELTRLLELAFSRTVVLPPSPPTEPSPIPATPPAPTMTPVTVGGIAEEILAIVQRLQPIARNGYVSLIEVRKQLNPSFPPELIHRAIGLLFDKDKVDLKIYDKALNEEQKRFAFSRDGINYIEIKSM